MKKKMQRLNCAQLIGDRTGRDLASQQDFQPLLDLGKQFNEWMSRLKTLHSKHKENVVNEKGTCIKFSSQESTMMDEVGCGVTPLY